LRNIQVSPDDFRFLPVSENDTETFNVIVNNANIPVLGSDICDTFGNLKYLNFFPSQIEVIQTNAFSNCLLLEFLSLVGQQIRHLDEDTFAGLTRLDTLYLAGNQLTQLPTGLFRDLKSLSGLHVYFNQLTEFSSGLVQNTLELRYLFLQTNEIFDLDIYGIVQALPKLNVINFDDNNFNCDHMWSYFSYLQQQNVTIAYAAKNKPRSFGYQLFNLNQFACLESDIWNAEFAAYLAAKQREVTSKLIEAVLRH